MVIIKFRSLHLLFIRQNNFTTTLRCRCPTWLWRWHIVAMKTSDAVARTTSLQRLILTSLTDTLQRCRFCNVVRRFHHSYMAASERRWIATSQQSCNDIIMSVGLLLQPEYGFCQQNGSELGQEQNWFLKEKIVVVPVCLNGRCCFSGCVGNVLY